MTNKSKFKQVLSLVTKNHNSLFLSQIGNFDSQIVHRTHISHYLQVLQDVSIATKKILGCEIRSIYPLTAKTPICFPQLLLQNCIQHPAGINGFDQELFFVLKADLAVQHVRAVRQAGSRKPPSWFWRQKSAQQVSFGLCRG